ncbi:MAG: enoyl-CoA hydratase-related protein [Alphaproteobacteria bacterium]|jgi:enoyl-CoA hydratase/carnithine racemase
MSVLEVEINDHIALVRLNRPDARNALDPEMLLTGKPIDAERALAAGLINYVADADKVVDVAMDLAAAIAANPPLAVRSARKVTRRTNELSEAEAIAMEAEELAFLATTEDAVEGPQAFMEKRAPVFKGR